MAKLNLSVILKHLDLRNLEVYEALRGNEEERKELDRVLSFILPLWYSGIFGGEDQLKMMIEFNRQVNIGWWDLEGHPELRAKVLGAIGVGHVVKHDFHYRERRSSETPLETLLMRKYPDIRKDEIILWCSHNSEATLTEICSSYGVQDKEKTSVIDSYRKLIS